MESKFLTDGTLRLDEPVELPDVLDLLIVGGGPAGTAAALRAKELGLDALVIDYDDLMKRIRDYAKDKLILPHFGGGDKMKFPKGGELISHLHFDPIDKDEMCAEWKGYYREFGIPAKVGVELSGAEQNADDTWTAQTWNHKTKEEELYQTRHLVIAMGRGVPRRFDIPGNTDGIAYKLDEAEKYVGSPACIIGGGTSAAEAVIALSNAKAEVDDDCAVYWSYRGEQMPKVSKALSEVFFDAYVHNGNVRYYPNSEPSAVVTGPDRNEYLSLRVDRKELKGRPIETPHLEFPKEDCIACIGEDIPESFLNELGVHMVKGGPRNKKRMAVTPLLETQQRNLYLIGDILSQAYLETDDFNVDPSSFREVKHRGNIKSALRDGVFIAEVVKQKLEGRETVQVDLEFEDEEATDDKASGEEKEKSASFIKTMVSPQGPPDESIPEERAVEEEQAMLVRMTLGGVDEDEFSLREDGVTTIGKKEADLTFPEDNRMSESHASVAHTAEGYVLRDDDSDTGTFLKLQPGVRITLDEGDILHVGREFLLFGKERGRPYFAQYDHTGQEVRRHTLDDGTFILGRKAPDIVLDANDNILSRRHMALEVEDGVVTARDLDSLNGTFLRIRDARVIEEEDVFRVGQQMFRLSVREETQQDSTTFRARPEDEDPGSAVTTTDADEETSESVQGPSVTFQSAGITATLEEGQTLLDAAQSEDAPLEYECESGFCGMDAVRVVSGGEYLSELGDREEDTLETLCDLEPGNDAGQCRLACLTKVTGPVVVEPA